MSDQERLQKLFDAALRSLDEPAPKPVTVAAKQIFAPPPWRTGEGAAPPQPTQLPAKPES